MALAFAIRDSRRRRAKFHSMYYLIPTITVILVLSTWMPTLVNKLPVVKLAQPPEIRTVVNSITALSQVYATLGAAAASGTLSTNPETKNLTFPAVDAAQSDGGASLMAATISKFAPPALKGFSWVYGQHPVDGSAYSGLYYFCMQPVQGEFLSPSAASAITAAASSFPASKFFYASACGAVADVPNLSGNAIHLTYYLPSVSVASTGSTSSTGASSSGDAPGSECKGRWGRGCKNSQGQWHRGKPWRWQASD